MNSVSQEVPRGLRAQCNAAVHSPVLQPGHTAPVWEGAQHPGKGSPSPALCKAPAFHLSSDWHGVRRGKGKEDMKRMWLQYLTQRPQHVSNIPNALFLSELYKQVTASKCIFKNTIYLITSNQWVTSVPGNCIKQKKSQILEGNQLRQ